MIINWIIKHQEYYGADIVVFRHGGYSSPGGLITMAKFFSIHRKPIFFSSLKIPGFKSLLRKDKFHR